MATVTELACPALAAGLVATGLAGLAVWWVQRRRLRAERQRSRVLAVAMVKLAHDLRGTLSPGLLMSERLESNADPAVRQAGAAVSRTLELAADLSRSVSRLAREHHPDL